MMSNRLQINDNSPYKFEHGYPTDSTVELAYNNTYLGRAKEAYKFFYPTMVTEAMIQELPASDKPNQVGAKFTAGPRHQFLTANSDTPYAYGALDLRTDGPMVIELPPGKFIGFVNDHNTRWVLDMGTIGPDKGEGGKHLVLPPDYKGNIQVRVRLGRFYLLSAPCPLREASPRRSSRLIA
jgi:hypothetical protein